MTAEIIAQKSHLVSHARFRVLKREYFIYIFSHKPRAKIEVLCVRYIGLTRLCGFVFNKNKSLENWEVILNSKIEKIHGHKKYVRLRYKYVNEYIHLTFNHYTYVYSASLSPTWLPLPMWVMCIHIIFLIFFVIRVKWHILTSMGLSEP